MRIETRLNDATGEYFSSLMAVKKLEEPNWFQSTSQPFEPVKGLSGVFGGHVLSQSVVCASQTVGPDLVCISSQSAFLIRGNPDVPFVYKVNELRSTPAYCHREVRVYQLQNHSQNLDGPTIDFEPADDSLVYIALIIFKRPTPGGALDHQAQPSFPRLANSEIARLPPVPDADHGEYEKLVALLQIAPTWHPIQMHKLNVDAYNRSKSKVSDRRTVYYFRSDPALKPLDGPNLVVAMMIYVSDRNSLFGVTNLQDTPATIERIGSLNHAFIVHSFDFSRDPQDYYSMETWSDRSFDHRGTLNGHIFANGNLIASFIQDGFIKTLL